MKKNYLIGYDIGSSSVKAVLLDADSGECLAEATAPDHEMLIEAPHSGWAEQVPESWWQEVIHATQQLHEKISFNGNEVKAIGITYQMHGLVCIDASGKVLRPAIIWCDSRAVETGQKAFDALGADYCLTHFLNAPGNFTLSKLKWVKENEPEIFEKIHKVMLPGDFIAYKMTGEAATTVSGLSEGIAWDYMNQELAHRLFEYYEIPETLFADVVPTFGLQGQLSASGAEALGLAKGIPVAYRAGDQPNNAYSLNVLNPGELAATAGTSGVVYGVTDQNDPDPLSRINTFVHVNNTPAQTRNGLLLCVNGTGISYSWTKKMLGTKSYSEMNDLAATAGLGAGGLSFFPFGNGSERILQNKNPGALWSGLDFNTHDRSHISRSVLEGVAFSLRLGLEVMEDLKMPLQVFRVGAANMFLSPLFRKILASLTGASIEVYDTNGAQGAARAAGIGIKYYATFKESFIGLNKMQRIDPDPKERTLYQELYPKWKEQLFKRIL